MSKKFFLNMVTVSTIVFIITTSLALFPQLVGYAKSPAAIFHVAPNGNCGSASPCFSTIQEAINTAQDGDTIKIAEGTYTATGLQVVYLDKALTLIGGYALDDWQNSDQLAHPTIIDAENVSRRRGIYIDGTNTLTTTLQGLIIQRGHVQNASGGGIYIGGGRVVLQNNRIQNNTTEEGTGAGIHIEDGEIRLSNNVIYENITSGYNLIGGLYVKNGRVLMDSNAITSNHGTGVGVSNGAVTLTNNVISENETGFSGTGTITLTNNHIHHNTRTGMVLSGKIEASDNLIEQNQSSGVKIEGGNISLQHNTIRDNSGTWLEPAGGGGIVIFSDFDTTSEKSLNAIISHNLIQNNSSRGCGGGVHLYGVDMSSNDEVTLTDNEFKLNKTSYGGGGLCIYSSHQATVNNNLFLENFSESNGGAISLLGDAMIMSQNIFHRNQAQNGSAIHIMYGTLTGSNNIISENVSPVESIYLSGGRLEAVHWTIANNGNYALTTEGDASASLTNSLVSGHSIAGLWGGNVTADSTLFYENGIDCGGGATCSNSVNGDPKFVNPTAGDYHLNIGSMAIDAGTNQGIAIDIDGQSRPMAKSYDLGADELLLLEPSVAQTVTVANHTISYLLPAGTFTETLFFVHVPHTAETVPPPPDDLTATSYLFAVNAAYHDTGELAQPTQPFSLTIFYDETELATLSEKSLALYYWDGSQWLPEPSFTIDHMTHSISAMPERLSIWALLGETHQIFLPMVTSQQ
ncbi:MAG: right-handed parallel beta-helix repeat-containing protein [Ardenticatenaceae bacterium]